MPLTNFVMLDACHFGIMTTVSRASEAPPPQISFQAGRAHSEHSGALVESDGKWLRSGSMCPFELRSAAAKERIGKRINWLLHP